MYLVSAIADFPAIANRLIGGEIKGWFGQWGETVVGLTATGLIVASAGFMHRRRVFVRV
jgi:hypothetical protein